NMPQMQPQVLDGVNKTSAVHSISGRVATELTKLLCRQASQQCVGMLKKRLKTWSQFAPGAIHLKLSVAVALNGAVTDAAKYPPFGRGDGVEADGGKRVGPRCVRAPGEGRRRHGI